MRRLGARLLGALLLLQPAAARAELAIEALALTVEIEGTKAVDSVFRVTLTVTGTDIASASVTPAGSAELPLTCGTPTSCSATQTLANQAALDALLPTTAKNYTILLTGLAVPPAAAPTVTDTFSFGRPAVPSPAITAPVDGSVIEPGEFTAQFAGCPACTAPTHTTLLEEGVLLEEADLSASSTSWTPSASLGGETDFELEVEHATGGSQSLTADGIGTGSEDDSYTFSSLVTHSDQIAFETGFAPPAGDFCIVVNDDAADVIDPTGCSVLTEPAGGILDTSDACSVTLAGVPIQYDFQLAANGRLSGIADADLDGDASFETHAELTGRLQASEGFLRQSLRVRLPGADRDTRLLFRLREQSDLATLVSPATPLEWLLEQRLRGKLAGARVDESSTGLRTLPPLPGDDVACASGPPRTGWKLSFTLTGSAGPTSGSLQLASGIDVALVAAQQFDFLTNQTRLRLDSKGADHGVRIILRRLAIDDTPDPDQIDSGAVQFRAFGQRGKLLLP